MVNKNTKKPTEPTSEKMVFHAASGHELVNQKTVLILKAKSYQPHKIRMMQLPKVIDFCLHFSKSDIKCNYNSLLLVKLH